MMGEYGAMRRLPAPTPVQQLLVAGFRQRKPMGIAVLAVLALGLVATLLMPNKYEAAASVRLEQQAPQVISVPDLEPQRAAQDAERFLQTQSDMVQSRTLASAVAKQLKAGENKAILAALDVDKDDADVRQEAVVGALMDGVNVKLGLNTRLAQITFTSRDPKVSADVANAYARQLVLANLASKTDTSTRAAEYLKTQLDDAKQKLTDSERSLLHYARSADLGDLQSLDATRGNEVASLRAQLIGHLSQSLAEAKARRIVAEQQWSQYKNAPAMALPQVQENRAVQDLIAERAKVAATRAGEDERYTSEYPSDTAAQIRTLDGQISSIAGNIKRSYQDVYHGAVKEESAIQGTIDGLNRSLLAERERSIGYSALKNEVEANKAFYEGLLQRYREVVAAGGAPSANVTIIDQAVEPHSKSSPKLMSNLALSLVLGLIAAMAIALVRERIQNVIRSTLDLGELDHPPFLGMIPVTAQGVNVEDALDDADSPQSEAYNSIAISLQKLASGHLPKSVMTTSSTMSEGKSTTALGLAKSLARMGKRVLLVDADLRRPSLGATLGQPEGPGLAEALAGGADAKPAIRHLEKQGFDFLAAGKKRGNPMGLLDREKVRGFIEQLTGEYDVVIVDAPPIMGLADAVILADCVDSVVVAAEANRIQASQLQLAVARLPGAKPVAGVLTKFDLKTATLVYGNQPYFTYA